MPKLVDQATYSDRAPARGRASRATSEQVAAWRSLARAHAAVARHLEGSLVGSGLDPSEYDVLVTLAEGPTEGLRPTELAARVLLTKSGMTRLLDRLVDRALIERRACPSDRRGQLIGLTREGRGLVRRATPELLRRLRDALGALSARQLAELSATLARVQEAASERAAG